MRIKRQKKTCSAQWYETHHDVSGHAETTAPVHCTHDARARGLCWGHYTQKRRGQEFHSLERVVTQEQLPPVRVDPSCAAELRKEAEANGVSLYAIVQLILESWAKSR